MSAPSNAGAIRIIFVRVHFTYYHGMAHFFPLMQQYVVIVNEKEGVSATDLLYREGRTSTYALAEMAKASWRTMYPRWLCT